MKKPTTTMKIKLEVLNKVRKYRKFQTIQGFIEQAIEERITKILKAKG